MAETVIRAILVDSSTQQNVANHWVVDRLHQAGSLNLDFTCFETVRSAVEFLQDVLAEPYHVLLISSSSSIHSAAEINDLVTLKLPAVLLLESPEDKAPDSLTFDDVIPREQATPLLVEKTIRFAIERFDLKSKLKQVGGQSKQELDFVAIQEQATFVEALRNIARIISSSLNPDVVFTSILHHVGRVVPHDAATIVLIKNGVGQIAYRRGHEEDYSDDTHRLIKMPVSIPTFAEMMVTHQPCLIADTHTSSQWTKTLGMMWIRSYLGVPIIINGEVMGLLNLDSRAPNFFTPTHLHHLQAFADHAAIALQNAQLYDKMRRDAEALKRLHRATSFLHVSLSNVSSVEEITKHIVQTIVKEFDAIDVSIFALKRNGNLYRVAQSGDINADSVKVLSANGQMGLVAASIQSAQTVYSPDVRVDPRYLPGDLHTRSELIIPLQMIRGTYGVLDIQSVHPNAFDEVDIRILEALTERAAAAIETVQLYEETRVHAEELDLRVRARTLAVETHRTHLASILEAMVEGVFYWESTPQGPQVQWVNQAVTTLTGYTEAELVSSYHFISKLASEDEALVAQEMYRLLNTQNLVSRDMMIRRSDGTTFSAALTLKLMNQPGDTGLRGMALLRDTSQERALQEQKDRFVANASHELRTPLSNFKLRLYLIRKQPHQLEQHLGVLEQVTDRMHWLVEDLLDISRFDRGIIQLDPKDFDLQEAVNNVITLQQPYAEEKRITLKTVLPDNPVIIFADSERISQVITNLVVNAINYTPEGGNVTVSVDCDLVTNIARIHVSDNGIGISAKLLPHIFEPFFRANVSTFRGTGLGLAISQEIIKLHNGTISVKSKENVGTTFTVELPHGVDVPLINATH